MDYTSDYINQYINPGGIYTAVWMRDAAYILKDHAASSKTAEISALEQILHIWSHQLDSTTDSENKIVYGRGSPETNFKPQIKEIGEISNNIDGALPTTIYKDFREIYGINPDIDSTALMISSTSWLLLKLLNDGIVGDFSSITNDGDNYTIDSQNHPKLTRKDASSTADFVLKAIEYLIPRMLYALDYLKSRDVDKDSLIEQQPNEDWMDTALRAGKVVYSQGCWILALQNLSDFFSRLGDQKASRKMMKLAEKTTSAVEENLWSNEKACYVDKLQSTEGDGKQSKDSQISVGDSIITQDVSLYLVAVTENKIANDYTKTSENSSFKSNDLNDLQRSDVCGHITHREKMLSCRATMALDTLKDRIWKNNWPLVTERVLEKTGPWILKPYQYHNHTFWPWITAVEMLARSRFSRFEECSALLSKLAGPCPPNIFSFYEWVDPVKAEGNGAFPFKTGISAVRMAISDVFDSK